MDERSMQRRIDRSTPPWMLTYADMATLLLVFFVFLFSASEISEARFQAATGSLQANLGYRPHSGSVVEPRVPANVSRRQERTDTRYGAPGERAEVLSVAEGTRVVLGGAVHFARASAELDAPARDALRRLADEIRGLPNIVEVHGHAEAGELEERARGDEMDLSLARAAAVVRFLADDAGIRARRLRALGAAAFEEAAAGLRSDESWRNRRVEVIVVRGAVSPETPGTAEGQ
jgi:chemotaxis protein MotB